MTAHTTTAATLRLLIAMMLITITSVCQAESWPFRVAFEDVPGVEKLISGDISGGIDILNAALKNESVDRGYGLATLCGALIMNQSLQKAEKICSDAVTNFPGPTAYNNRGVLRAFAGDYPGAKKDFERARPQQLDEYMAYLKTRDVGLIADNNFGLLDRLVSKQHDETENPTIARKATARIESFND